MEKVQVFYPGAAKFGNFINYYSFNSADKRVKAMPSDLLSHLDLSDQIVCLDVGCNSGELTFAAYSHLKAGFKESTLSETCPTLSYLGIDLDAVLISRCKETNPYPTDISFEEMDIMHEESISKLNVYLKNIGRDKFDLVTCFSTTMWIHLNHGDDGLRNFLQKISKLALFLLLEPQNWKCYKSANRRMRRLKQDSFNLSVLQLQKSVTNDINVILEEDCSMKLLSNFGETSWGRELKLYKNTG